MSLKDLTTVNQELRQLAAQTRAFHPLAAMFPLLGGKEFDALVADIQANGLREKITLYNGKILDGRNRYRATFQAGIEPQFEQFEGDEASARAFVISKNIHRRHLKPKEKRDLIAKLIEAQPEKSDRQIGKMAQVSKNTAKSVRDEMEARGQIDHVETRTDTRGRKQPAKKRNKPIKPAPVSVNVEKIRNEASSGEIGDSRGIDLGVDGGGNFHQDAGLDGNHGHHRDDGGGAARDNIGSNSADEMARKDARIEEREPEGEGNELGNLLRAWDRASQGTREKFKTRVGLVAVKPSTKAMGDGLDIPGFLRRDAIADKPAKAVITTSTSQVSIPPRRLFAEKSQAESGGAS
jgi:hypothetical protein